MVFASDDARRGGLFARAALANKALVEGKREEKKKRINEAQSSFRAYGMRKSRSASVKRREGKKGRQYKCARDGEEGFEPGRRYSLNVSTVGS